MHHFVQMRAQNDPYCTVLFARFTENPVSVVFFGLARNLLHYRESININDILHCLFRHQGAYTFYQAVESLPRRIGNPIHNRYASKAYLLNKQ